ncbi:MAG: uracil-DNA glycosylase family protein [Deltaproteobacteria bacterium]|nr:uracil-DNA glycosylase family protein [Deltaproteobacteria bacterium]
MVARASTSILEEIAAEARREAFPRDIEAYAEAGRDPALPIAWAGNPTARACVVGRDLGWDEVHHGQPLVGPSGKLVRLGVLNAVGMTPSPEDKLLTPALDHVFLTNIVPYKPPKNRAFGEKVRERFRPQVERVIACIFQGSVVLTLGNEALAWFARYGGAVRGALLARPEDRYQADYPCVLTAACDGGNRLERALTVCPLPHPSPASAKWKAQFPGLLAARLSRCMG